MRYFDKRDKEERRKGRRGEDEAELHSASIKAPCGNIWTAGPGVPEESTHWLSESGWSKIESRKEWWSCFFQSVPFTMHTCNVEKKKLEESTTCPGRDWPLKSTATDWLGCSSWWLFALHLPPLSLQSGSCYCTQSISCFLRAQMANRITMMARWKPLRWCQVSFALFHFCSPTHTHTQNSPCMYMLIFKHTSLRASQITIMNKYTCINTRIDTHTHTHRLTLESEISSNWPKITINTLHLY